MLNIHYFKTKENMTTDLVDLLIEKYEAPEFLQFDHIQNMPQRFNGLMDTIFLSNGPGPSTPAYTSVSITSVSEIRKSNNALKRCLDDSEILILKNNNKQLEYYKCVIWKTIIPVITKDGT